MVLIDNDIAQLSYFSDDVLSKKKQSLCQAENCTVSFTVKFFCW